MQDISVFFNSHIDLPRELNLLLLSTAQSFYAIRTILCKRNFDSTTHAVDTYIHNNADLHKWKLLLIRSKYL